MSKATKIWLSAAALLTVIGLIGFTVALALNGWNIGGLNTREFVTNVHGINEEFSRISINTDTADITLVPSDGEECTVECTEEKKAIHSVSVEADTLVIKVVDDRAWYDYIGIGFGTAEIKVYLPNAEYARLAVKGDTGDVKVPAGFTFDSVDIAMSTGDVKISANATGLIKIESSTGDIKAENLSAGGLDLSVATGRVSVSDVTSEGEIRIKTSTGKVKLNDVKCKSLRSNGSTGDISLKSLIATEGIYIDRSTGDVEFERTDAAELVIKTSTGDVEGSLLTDKIFAVESSTGKVRVPNTSSGGKCSVKTSTGDVEIRIKP